MKGMGAMGVHYVLPARVDGYRPGMLDELCAGGELVWIGAGQGRVGLYLRGEAAYVTVASDVIATTS